MNLPLLGRANSNQSVSRFLRLWTLLFAAALVMSLAQVLTLSAGTATAQPAAGQPQTGPGTLSAGGYHTCQIVHDGNVQCWGMVFGVPNPEDGNPLAHPTAVRIDGVENARQLASGLTFTCALLADRTVTCWGEMNYLPNGERLVYESPTTITGLEGIVQIAAGPNGICAVSVSGALSCWGSFISEGRSYGTSDGWFSSEPAPMDLGSAVNVAVNASEVCALRSDRTVRCRLWTIYPDGPNQGMGQPRVKDYTPSVSDVSSLDLNGGGSQDCAVLFSGAVTCWSPRNIYGSGTTTRLNIGAKASASPSMGAHQCALLTTGEVTCVSSMPAFRGDGTTDTRFYNVEDMRLGESKVKGVSDAYAISAGVAHVCAAMPNMVTKCWGWNDYGQLGNGTTVGSNIPVDVKFSFTSAWDQYLPVLGTYDCSKPFFIGVRGSGETPQSSNKEDEYAYPVGYTDNGMGWPVDSAYKALDARHPGKMNQLGLSYPAIPATPENLASLNYNFYEYRDSVNAGVRKLDFLYTVVSRKCEGANPQIILSGYSQGANVINKFLVQTQQTAPERLNNLNAVILFGDPNRIPSTPGNSGSAGDLGPGGVVNLNPTMGEVHIDVSPFVNAHPKVLSSFCIAGDAVCNPNPLSMAGSRKLGNAIHTSYAQASDHCWISGTSIPVRQCAALVLEQRLGWSGAGDSPAANTTLSRGQEVVVSANGMKKNTAGRALLASDPVLVGEFTTDDQGSAVVSFHIPSDAHDGDHRIILETDGGDHLEVNVLVSDTQASGPQIIGISAAESNSGGGDGGENPGDNDSGSNTAGSSGSTSSGSPFGS